MTSARHRSLLWAIVFFAAYALAGWFGNGLRLIPGVAITFWPPAGVFMATLIMTRRRSWPLWILAGCLSELALNAALFHNPLVLAIGYFAGNVLTAVLGATLIRWVCPRPFRLDSLEQAAALVFFGAAAAPVASATVIAAIDAGVGKHTFVRAWSYVWLGDCTGLLVSGRGAHAIPRRRADPLGLGALSAHGSRRVVGRACGGECVADGLGPE